MAKGDSILVRLFSYKVKARGRLRRTGLPVQNCFSINNRGPGSEKDPENDVNGWEPKTERGQNGTVVTA